MTIPTSSLHFMLRQLPKAAKMYDVGSKASSMPETLENLIIGHAAGAAAASFAAGFIPGGGSLVALAVAAGFIWSMYYRICKNLHIDLSRSKAKALGAAVCSNLATGLASYLVAGAIIGLIPGVGSWVLALLDFATVYVAAMIFIKLLLDVFKAKKSIETMSEKELKDMADTIVKETDLKQAAKEAKSAFKTAKRDGTIQNADAKPMEDID